MTSVYDAAGGADGLRRLAAAWHERVMADEVVAHAFSHGYHPEHTAVVEALRDLDLAAPSVSPEMEQRFAEARKALEKE